MNVPVFVLITNLLWSQITISEVMFDLEGSDSPNEFVEIYNYSDDDIVFQIVLLQIKLVESINLFYEEILKTCLDREVYWDLQAVGLERYYQKGWGKADYCIFPLLSDSWFYSLSPASLFRVAGDSIL